MAARQPLKKKGRKGTWTMILIDQEPIRQAAASECSRALARLEKVRGEWKQFDQEDRPGFERWKAAHFGALLTELRETEALLREKESLVHEVEMEYKFGGGSSYAAAYKRVMRRRAAPPKAERSFRDEPPPMFGRKYASAGADDGMPDFIAQEFMFQDFARMFLGINPERLSDRDYERMFQEFRRNVLRDHRPPPDTLPGFEFGDEPLEPPEPPKPESLRIKEIYRVLVRRLHPDLRADKDAKVSAFWHEVQEAYAEGNVERLEMLVALTDLESESTGAHTSLFQMRSVLKELKSALRALSRSLREAKSEPAWNFSRLADRARMQAEIQQRLKEELADFKKSLARLEGRIAQWAVPARRKNGRAEMREMTNCQ